MLNRIWLVCGLLLVAMATGCSSGNTERVHWYSWTSDVAPADQKIRDAVSVEVQQRVDTLERVRAVMKKQQSDELSAKEEAVKLMSAQIDRNVDAQITALKEAQMAIDAKQRQDAYAAAQQRAATMSTITIPEPAVMDPGAASRMLDTAPLKRTAVPSDH